MAFHVITNNTIRTFKSLRKKSQSFSIFFMSLYVSLLKHFFILYVMASKGFTKIAGVFVRKICSLKHWAKITSGTVDSFLEIVLFLFFSLFAFSRAASVAYEGSQARGLIGAVAASCAKATATQDSSHVCDLPHSSQQRRIPNPLSKARDGTGNLMVPSWIR